MLRIVDFPYEMFNDAMYFLEEAKKLNKVPENDWLRWRYLRASILFSFTSLEAYVNLFISSRLPKSSVKKFIKVRLSIESKLDKYLPRLTGKSIGKLSQEWKDFTDIRKIRNKLVHYKGGTRIYHDQDPNGINILNAEKGIKMVRDMIKYLNGLAGTKHPLKYDQAKSRIIR